GAHRRAGAGGGRAAARADVVVLAQASMAPAARLADVAAPVLTSPVGGVASLLRVVGPAPAASS
ncbi:MAG: hypothetical protein IRZ05_00520, partial [Micromonosporaceae bacterium]|nr:hypothetical protein [Micromonosporaceae bacterium]